MKIISKILVIGFFTVGIVYRLFEKLFKNRKHENII